MITDNDRKHWKLGVFYYDPKNPSRVVNRRNGMGSSINFGNKEGRHLFEAMMIPAFIAIILLIAIVALN